MNYNKKIFGGFLCFLIAGIGVFFHEKIPRNFLFASIFTSGVVNSDMSQPSAIPTFAEEDGTFSGYFDQTQIFGDAVVLDRILGPFTQKINELFGNGPDLDAFDQYGSGVASVGDLDGDGVTDMAVGSPNDSDGGGSNGAVYIHFLNADGTVKTTQKISELAGNGPNLDSADNYGGAVASIGDLDDDGVIDIAVGSPNDNDGGVDGGAVYIHFLNTDGTVKATQKISELAGGGPALDDLDRYGLALAGIGDLDGDLVEDIVVSSPGDDDGAPNGGAVYVHFMNTDGTVRATQKISELVGNGPAVSAPNQYGSSIALIGDLDNDTIQDIAVGGQEDNDGGFVRGAVYVHFMNTDGTVRATQKISDLAGNGPALHDFNYYGSAITGIGYFDGDTVEDIAVGAPFDNDGGPVQGAVYVHLMNTDGTVKSTQKISELAGNGPDLDISDFYGWAITSLGDLDGDGITEIAAGAPFDADSGSLSGAVYVHFLDATGIVRLALRDYETTGTYSTPVEIDSGDLSDLLEWERLLVNQAKPTNTDITYEIFSAGFSGVTGCTGASLVGPFSAANQGGGIDGAVVTNLSSSIDTDIHTELCLQITLTTTDVSVTPTLSGWRQNYHVDRDGDGISEFAEDYLYACLDDGDAVGDLGADGDPDNDGISNIDEVNRGRNPCEGAVGSGKRSFSSSDGFGRAAGSGKAYYPILYKSAAEFKASGGIDRSFDGSVIQDKRIGESLKGGVAFEENADGIKIFRGYFSGRIYDHEYKDLGERIDYRYRGEKTQESAISLRDQSSSRLEKVKNLRNVSLQDRIDMIGSIQKDEDDNNKDSELENAKNSAENISDLETVVPLRDWREVTAKNAKEKGYRRLRSRHGQVKSQRAYSAAQAIKNAQPQIAYNFWRGQKLAPKRNHVPDYVATTKIQKRGFQNVAFKAGGVKIDVSMGRVVKTRPGDLLSSAPKNIR